jgi:tRNA C32,U32 (ribose-2'-O)-methylase TrmJ
MLVEALERSGYVNPRTAGSATTKARRLVRRLSLTARDAAVVLGMLRQILWKLKTIDGIPSRDRQGPD